MKASAIFTVVVVVVACGSSAPPPERPQATTGIAQPRTPEGYDVPWSEMSRQQKIELMKKRVMPRLGPAFKKFDGERFANPDCTMCHGDGVIDGTFAMPNPELPHLDFGPGYAEYKAKHAAVIEFMESEVKIAMAEVLAVDPWTPENQAGFGCFACHPTAAQ